MSTTKLTITGTNGHAAPAEVVVPGGTGKVGTVIVLQEYWGLNDHIRSVAERVAKEGYLVVVPDLYHGKLTKDVAEAQALMSALDTMHAMRDIGAAVAFAKNHERSNGNVGVIGFCMGGALALAAACHVQGLAAVVTYYGVPPEEKVDWAKVTAPVQAHFAQHDGWATVVKAEEIKGKLGEKMELFTYDAQHAFSNDSRAEVYSADNAKLAWKRSFEFFAKNLSHGKA